LMAALQNTNGDFSLPRCERVRPLPTAFGDNNGRPVRATSSYERETLALEFRGFDRFGHRRTRYMTMVMT